MNLLFLSTENPYPPDHGHHLRTYHILRHLAEAHRVFFVGFSQSPEELRYKAHLESFCAGVDIFPIAGRSQKARYVFDLFRNLFSAQPFSVQRYFIRNAAGRIRQIIKDHRIDLVHFDMIHLAPYRNCIGKIPGVLVNHNVESVRLLRLAHVQKNPAARLYLFHQYGKMQRFEKRVSPKFNRVIAVSETDADILQAACNLKGIAVIPNGVDADFFQPAGGAPEPDSLVWVGGMSSPYNRDAVDYFLEEIFPKIRAERPALKVLIVGNSPSAKLQEHAARYPQNIEISGYVDDVRPFMQRAGIFIAPMRCGSGTKIKVLNAMAMGKAVVTTSVGAEGINAVSGKDLIIADTPTEFAKQVLVLLRHPEHAQRLGDNGRKIVERYYDWRVINKSMDALYENLAPVRPPAQAPQPVFEHSPLQNFTLRTV